MVISFSTELNEKKQLTNACWQVNPIKMENTTLMDRVVVVRRLSHFSKLIVSYKVLANLATEREHHFSTPRAEQILKYSPPI